MRNLTIALDIMGGDYGPRSTIPAAILAVNQIPNVSLILCGDHNLIQSELAKLDSSNHPRIRIEHTDQVVNMDELPAHAVRCKKQSSMRRVLDLVQQGQADACVSSGNTGALLAMSHFVLKTLPGINRPALVSTLPTHTNHSVTLLDLGANVSCDSEGLVQFAIMGSVLVEEVEGKVAPKVALLNMGQEEIKGSAVVKQAAACLSQIDSINYVGYVEGDEIFTGKADVVVCDGFVGNVALKTCEGMAKLIIQKLRKAVQQSFFNKFLGFLLLPAFKKLYKSMNPDQYNGASLLGLRGIVVKSHGNASKEAFLAAIREAVKEAERQVPEKIKHKLERVLNEKS